MSQHIFVANMTRPHISRVNVIVEHWLDVFALIEWLNPSNVRAGIDKSGRIYVTLL